MGKLNRIIRTALLLVLAWAGGWWSHGYWHRTAPDEPPARPAFTPLPDPPVPAPVVAPAPQPLAKLAALLAAERYRQALNAYVAWRNEPERLSQARRLILQRAQSLLTTGRGAAAVDLLTIYLEQEFRDVEALRLLAAAQHQAGEVLAAIETLYTARGYAHRDADLRAITQGIRQWVSTHMAALRQRDDKPALGEFLTRLTQLEPEHAGYMLYLAEAQLALQDYAAARLSLQLILHDPAVGAQATRLLARLEARDPSTVNAAGTKDMSEIALVRQGGQFVVEAWINEQTTLRLLIDTGASMTTINPSALENTALNADDTGQRVSFATAGGRVQAAILRLASLRIGDQTVAPLDVAAIELEGSAFDGLLGMNFLSRYRFFIDQGQGVLRLSPR